MTDFTSKYDPNRDTVGKIYRDAQISSTGTEIEVGDMARELTKSLVEDINDTIASNIHRQNPYFILIHEKKDLQMKSALLRRMCIFDKRPWPEDDTVVFKVFPKEGEVRFCWCLPHHSDMWNILANSNLFDYKTVHLIKSWQNMDLWQFGFCKDEIGNWIENPNYQDEKLEATKQAV